MSETLTAAASGAESLLVSIPEAARLLDLSEATVFRLIADGELATVKMRSATRIARVDLETFIVARRSGRKRQDG